MELNIHHKEAYSPQAITPENAIGKGRKIRGRVLKQALHLHGPNHNTNIFVFQLQNLTGCTVVMW